MVTNFITRDGDDDMNISYVNSNKTTSLPVELDALNNKDISYAKDFFLYIETQLKIAKDFCRPGEEVSSSIASKVFHAFIDLVNKSGVRKTLCIFARFAVLPRRLKVIILITGPFYLILVINIRLNLHKAEKRVSLTLEFNDTIIESQKVTGNKAKHILEDIEIFYRNKPDTYY